MLDEDRPAYERQYGETDRAWEMFVQYRDLGEGRTLQAVLRNNEMSPSYKDTLSGWNKKYRWQERVLEYDRMIDKRRQEEQLKQVAKTTREMAAVAESMWKLAAKDLIKWHNKIQAAGPNDPGLSPADLRSLVDTGMRLHRLNLDQPDSIQEKRLDMEKGERKTIMRKLLSKTDKAKLDEIIDSLYDE